ncbi:MAG TPA: serine/threonine-protein kinase, partial [Thermosynechococcaceae cyanobacterium]
MPLCLNPHCPRPENPEGVRCCACGAILLLDQRYRAIAAIGQGGFGRTFLAVDEAQPGQPQCVIKQFLPLLQGPRHLKKAVELFEQEAQRLEELGDHPQIPTLLAHFSQDRQQYLIQEFVAGPTIAEILEQRGAFTEPQIRSLLTSLLPVLKFIHSRSVIHRDIKPANIIAAVSQQTRQNPVSEIGGLIGWNRLLQALSQEAAQGCRNQTSRNPVSYPAQFNEFLSQHLRQLPTHWAIADYRRCQDLAEQFSRYLSLSFSQRQYLVADASRLLYEMRQRYEREEGTITAPLVPVPDPASDLTLVLVDFGAAKSVQGSLTQTGTAIGSPEYQAPEQARGKAVFASDLYSLGVTCLHLLTHTSPLDLFDPNESTWQWRRHLKSPVSPELGHLLDKLVEPGLRRRFPSAITVLQALHPLSASLNLPTA